MEYMQISPGPPGEPAAPNAPGAGGAPEHHACLLRLSVLYHVQPGKHAINNMGTYELREMTGQSSPGAPGAPGADGAPEHHACLLRLSVLCHVRPGKHGNSRFGQSHLAPQASPEPLVCLALMARLNSPGACYD